MSRRKREPVAEIGADDYRIVRHTHDVDLARRLMVAAMIDEDGCPAWDNWPAEHHGEACFVVAAKYWARRLELPRQVYMRILPALPNSYAEAEGWAFTYHECQRGPGAFPAVVFR